MPAAAPATAAPAPSSVAMIAAVVLRAMVWRMPARSPWSICAASWAITPMISPGVSAAIMAPVLMNIRCESTTKALKLWSTTRKIWTSPALMLASAKIGAAYSWRSASVSASRATLMPAASAGSAARAAAMSPAAIARQPRVTRSRGAFHPADGLLGTVTGQDGPTLHFGIVGSLPIRPCHRRSRVP